MKQIKKEFCSGCGAEVKIKKYIGGYNTETGKPFYYRKRRCINYKFFSFTYHTNYDEGKGFGDGLGAF